MKTLSLLIAAAMAVSAETPSELVGEWASFEGANPSFVYRIAADDRFESSLESITLSPGCDTRTSALSEGRLTIDGAVAHLDAASARFRSVNTCRPKWDYEKPGQLGRNSFRWRVQREGPVWILVLQQRSGTMVRLMKR